MLTIAEECNRISTQGDKPIKLSCQRTKYRYWTAKEIAELAAGKGRRGFYFEFAKRTGRSLTSVKGKARNL